MLILDPYVLPVQDSEYCLFVGSTLQQGTSSAWVVGCHVGFSGWARASSSDNGLFKQERRCYSYSQVKELEVEVCI